MTDSALYPPNSRWLSDNLISSVVQRSGSLLGKRGYANCGAYDDDGADTATSPESALRFKAHDWPREDGHPQPFSDETPPRHTAKRVATITRPKGARAHRSSSRRQYDDDATKQSELDALSRHRERRRLAQIRYRTKVRNRAETLEEQVQALSHEVHELEQQRRRVSPSRIWSSTPCSLIAEYFRLFRYTLAAQVPVSASRDDSQPKIASTEQQEFLFSTMHPDVTVDGDRGVEALLQRWRFISQVQPSFEVQPVQLQYGPGGSIVAATKTRIMMCRSTLTAMFPSLLKSERGRSIAARLQGNQFEIDGSTYFEWDSTSCRVLSMHNKSDLMTPMLRSVGNLED